MKIAIVECISKSNCQDAHVRQAFFIKDYLKSLGHNVELFFIDTLKNYIHNKYDVIIKSYSSFYENYKDEVELYKNNQQAKFFYLTNEYTIQTSGIFAKKEFKELAEKNIICNFDTSKITGKNWNNKYFVNLNALFYQPKEKQDKKYNICYFGTYRKDRKISFEKYFTSKDFILSTSPKSIKKFSKDKCLFTPCKRFKWGNKKDTLGLFKYSLYIEDEWIHNNFHNLADRFYEALSNETVTLFDEKCINTLKKSELKDVDFYPFIITAYKDIENRNYIEDWKLQKEWINVVKEEKEKALSKIGKIIVGQLK